MWLLSVSVWERWFDWGHSSGEQSLCNAETHAKKRSRHNISEHQTAGPLGTHLTEGNLKYLLSQEMDVLFVSQS